MKFAGIDPGLEGGLSTIERIHGNLIISTIKMPRKNSRIHVEEFVDWLSFHKPDVIGIEQLLCPTINSRMSIQTAGVNWGKIIALIEYQKVEYQIYRPNEWHDLVNLPRDDRDVKQRSIARCKELYPQVELIPKGCRTPQDGLADGLLIAHATMIQFERNLKMVG